MQIPLTGAVVSVSRSAVADRLVLFRIAWWVIALATLVLYAVALPLRWAELASLFQNLSPAQELVLRDAGVSGQQHAAIVLTVEVAVPVVYFVVAALIFWRRSDKWPTVLFSAGLMTYAAWISPAMHALVASQSPWRLPANLVEILGVTAAMLFFFGFPDGRFVPRWSRVVLAVWGVWGLVWLLAPASPLDLSSPFRLSAPGFVLLVALMGAAFGSQVYRFTRAASVLQRQQTKLVLFGTAIAFSGYLAYGFDRFASPALSEPHRAAVVYDLVGVPLVLLAALLIPLSVAASILRYRLWDIEVIVERALVYAALTAILGGLYTASITLSQRVFVALTGERSDAAIVLTTLGVAAAFTPVRTWLQSVVDRRLACRADPARNLRVFADEVRSFVEKHDVQQLTHRALEEATAAFGASGGAVCLREGEHFRPTQVLGEWCGEEGVSAWLDCDETRYGWIVLGPRRNGLAYRTEDEAALTELVTLVARAIKIAQGPAGGPWRQVPERSTLAGQVSIP
jgi:hypothetical protein